MTAEYTPRTTIETEPKREKMKKREKALAAVACGTVLGSMGLLGLSITGNTGEINPLHVDDEKVESYRAELDAIVHDGKQVESEMNEPVKVTYYIDGEQHTYKVDDDPETRYKDEAPNYVRALDEIDPILFEASGTTKIKFVDIPGKDVGYVRPYNPHTIFLDEEYVKDSTASEVARLLRHEAGHNAQFTAAPMRLEVRFPAFTDENPPGVDYYKKASIDEKKTYDTEFHSERMATSEYGTTNEMEDFAEYVDAMTAVDDNVGGPGEMYMYNVKRGDDLTLDKSAAVLAAMEKVDPKLAESTLDGIEDKVRNRL